MLIRELDPETFVRAYNVDLQVLYPWEGVVEPPFGAVWAVLAPGESTKPHAHQECETFFIARGRGVMSIGEERVEVTSGHVTFHRPFDNHTLTNTSDTEDLLFLSVYWEDRGQWEGKPAETPEAEPRRVERVMVTAAPPTPNGDLHLGHLSGPYLSADFYTRSLRLRGLDAHFACGSDDNSLYVEAMGQQMGLATPETARTLTAAIEETLAAAGVDLTVFPHPNASPHHRELTRGFFRTLYDGGHLEEKVSPVPWCESCGLYLVEYHLRGRCPHCGSGMMGNTCEDCGRVTDYIHVADPTCSGCGATPVPRDLRRLVFPLGRWVGALRELYRKVEMSPHLRALCESVLAEGPADVAVTYPSEWGIEVPLEGWEDQRIYVWLEMAPRYLAYARHLNEKLGSGEGWERWWKSPRAQVVQFFGFDNSFFYALLIPAMFTAFDPELRLPAALVTNEFYHLEGEKFSTSRDHRILGRDLMGRAPRDAVRFYLAYTCPERESTNFTLEGFRETVRRELLGGWQPWLADLFGRLAEGFGGAVPATGDWTPEHRRFYHRLKALLAEAEGAYEAGGFSPQRAARAMCEVAREAWRFGRGERHWEGLESHGEEWRTGVALELLAAKVLGLVAAPVMPELAERLWRALGFEGGPGTGDWGRALEWVPAGQRAPGLEGPLVPGLAEYLGG